MSYKSNRTTCDTLLELVKHEPDALVKYEVTDAMLWAESFESTIKRNKSTIEDINASWLVAWFASAIETTKDSMSREKEEE